VIALRPRPQPALRLLLGGLLLALAVLLGLAATQALGAKSLSPRVAPVTAQPPAAGTLATAAPSSVAAGATPERAAAPQAAPLNRPAAQAAPAAPVAPAQPPRIATTAPPESDNQQLPP
jgi:heme A synthase